MTKRIRIDDEYRINIHVKKNICKCYAFFGNEVFASGTLPENETDNWIKETVAREKKYRSKYKLK